jgi:L-amino acid N-acyltransferase YncA
MPTSMTVARFHEANEPLQMEEVPVPEIRDDDRAQAGLASRLVRLHEAKHRAAAGPHRRREAEPRRVNHPHLPPRRGEHGARVLARKDREPDPHRGHTLAPAPGARYEKNNCARNQGAYQANLAEVWEATINIRNAVETDLTAIVEIYNSTVPGRMVTADTEPVSVESRLPWFHEHDPESHPIWVAEVGGEIAGWLSFEPFRERPAYRATAEVSVYVSENHRRQGVGRMLLEEALRQSPALGLKTLTAGAFAHNVPSLELLGDFGFERWAHFPRVAELDGIERDLVVLGLRLDEGPAS